MSRCGKVLVIALGVVSGCGNATSPTSVTGSYAASHFAIFGEDGDSIDLVAAGASLTIELLASRKTTGRLFIPTTPQIGPGFDASLAGNWTRTADTVRFSHTADTFVRDLPFAIRGSTLVGDKVFAGIRVKVTLSR